MYTIYRLYIVLPQDANGGIWKLDLSFSYTSATPERLMYYHAGAIAGCSSSPVSHLVATAGADKTVRVHDYSNNITLCETILNAEGTSVVWAPKLVSIFYQILDFFIDISSLFVLFVSAVHFVPYLTGLSSMMLI